MDNITVQKARVSYYLSRAEYSKMYRYIAMQQPVGLGLSNKQQCGITVTRT